MISTISTFDASISLATASTSEKTQNSLTDEQLSLITETLSQYDVDNITETDAAEIVETLTDAGIVPGQGLEEALSELGFDAKEIGNLAQQQDGNSMPPPPPPPKQDSLEISTIAEYLTESISEKLAETEQTELTEEQNQQILDNLYEAFGLDKEEYLINTSA